MKLITSVSGMQRMSSSARRRGEKIAFVPTMGFLHEGHAKLLRVGKSMGDILVLSIFVNPIQFGKNEDLAAYPTDFLRDSEIARREGVDIIFRPEPKFMYPEGFQAHVEVSSVTRGLCGEFRPGHFRGVTTVVAKLFNIVQPTYAIFGKKDFQQLAALKTMVRDLNMDVRLVPVETVREEDGLAMSSRNSYLSPEERKLAAIFPSALFAARAAAEKGARDSKAILREAREILRKKKAIKIQYLEIVDPETLEPVRTVQKKAVIVGAIFIGKTRLIDNLSIP